MRTAGRILLYLAAIGLVWALGTPVFGAFAEASPTTQGQIVTILTITLLVRRVIRSLRWRHRETMLVSERQRPSTVAVMGPGPFDRWVDAQLAPGQDREELRKRLAPLWKEHQGTTAIGDEARARHEAAHAVVAIGFTVIGANIHVSGHDGGCVESIPPLPSRGLGPDVWDTLTMTVAANVLDQAEGRHHYGASQDIQAAETRAAALLSTGYIPDGCEAFLTVGQTIACARSRADRILARRLSQVDALADALLARRTWMDGRSTPCSPTTSQVWAGLTVTRSSGACQSVSASLVARRPDVVPGPWGSVCCQAPSP